MKHIYFTVTNDLTYDQRMNRICTTLADNGYSVTLVGRQLPASRELTNEKYRQKRLKCIFQKGKLFYAEYNLRLLLFLLSRKMDGICAIDLDTILPCYYISKWKRVPRIYDAHEFFTELKEVVTRPKIRRLWMSIERRTVPRFVHGYTVGKGIALEFERRYGVRYTVIRNIARLREITETIKKEKFLLYQGAVNEGRAFEQLIPAMKWIDCRLIVCGDGNFMPQLKQLILDEGVSDRVELMGMVAPPQLWEITQRASIGLTLFEKTGINQYLSLPNRFFDYIHAAVPQVAMNYPEYRQINDEFGVAVLLDDLSPERIGKSVNNLLHDDVLYGQLRRNCLRAREVLNWQQEEKKLLEFYQSVFSK